MTYDSTHDATRPDAAPASPIPELTPRPTRLLSLDIFRGFNIAGMILVNMTWDRENLPWQMFHVGWNAGEQGVTFTDLVFPWFIFIAGVAIPFSMLSGRGRSMTAAQKLASAGRRALAIYFLGLLLDAASSGSFVFLKWNILQMIAGAYFIATALFLLPRWAQAGFVVMVLALKWYVLSIYPHPEHGESVWYFAVDGQIVDDRYAAGAVPVNGEQVFKSRLLGLRDDLPFAGTLDWGPLLGWLGNLFNLLPAATVAVMGAWVGAFVRRDRERTPRTGLTLLALGGAAWLVSWLWNLHHPWSKDFFTASYALLTLGTGSAVLGLFYLLLDARPGLDRRPALVAGGVGLAAAIPAVALGGPPWLQEWTVGLAVTGVIAAALQHTAAGVTLFRVFGMNAIALYFVNEMLFKMVFTEWALPLADADRPMINALYGWLRQDRIEGSRLDLILGGWAFAAVWLTACWLFVRWLDKRGWYIRV